MWWATPQWASRVRMSPLPTTMRAIPTAVGDSVTTSGLSRLGLTQLRQLGLTRQGSAPIYEDRRGLPLLNKLRKHTNIVQQHGFELVRTSGARFTSELLLEISTTRLQLYLLPNP